MVCVKIVSNVVKNLYIFGEDIIGSPRRLGLITFPLAMVLSALHLHDTGDRHHPHL